MDAQGAQTAPLAPHKPARKTPIIWLWAIFATSVIIAAYIHAGVLRLATLAQLFSGYDVFSVKRFDVPRLPPAKNFEVALQKSGKLTSVTVRDNYAYIGAGESLLIVNIADPRHLQTVGSLLLLGQISDIVLDGNYAYICNGRGGFRIVDVSNPEKPKEVAAYGHMAVPKKAVVRDGCAYIAAGMRGLEVLDVRNPIRPVAVSFEDRAVGKYGTLDAKSICIDSDRLCVLDEDQGVRLFDISNPHKPAPLGEWKAGGRGLRRGAAVVDGKTILIAGDSPDAGVSLLDIKGSKPALTASLDVPSYWYGTSAKVRDGFAYIGTSSGLLVVDITDKRKPVRLSSFNGVQGITDLDFKGHTIFATNDAGSLSVIDVSDPFSPLLVSSQRLGGNSQMLSIQDGTLYSTSGLSEIHSFKLPLDGKVVPAVQDFDFKSVRAFCRVGEDVAVADERFPNRGTRISLVTLLRKQPNGKFKEVWSQTVDKSNRELAGSGDYVFAAAENGIHIFQKNGNNRFFYPMKTGADLLCSDGDRLYVVTETGPKNTLLITFDAKDPEHLKKVGQTAIDERAYALASDNQYVYALEGGVWGDRELSIFEKKTDGAPNRIGSLKIKQADRLAIDGQRAYVQGFLEVKAVDIKNPRNPKIIASVDLSAIPLSASDIEAKDGIVYIAGQDGGIYTLKDKTLN
ncbi:MAG: hypothetical protein C0507_18665 [Cyanobacteria bacterium PR.3.49]|nr:hypothetical protein [Cyanobacteria bacterium PR.3.49]